MAKKKKVKPIPDNYHNFTAYLICQGAAAAIDFYKKIFGAKERMRMPAPGGKVGHAELKFGDTVVMMADEFPEMNALSPKSIGGSPVGLMLYVKNADAVVEKAVAAGAKLERAVANQFYGDRSGNLVDPWGHKWTIATHIEDLTPTQMKKRMAAMKK